MKLREEFEALWKKPFLKDEDCYLDKLYTPSQIAMNNRKQGAYIVFVAAYEMGLNARKELPQLPECLKNE